MAEKKRNEELATKDNVKPLIEKALRTLLSGYKQILLECLNKLEEKYRLSSPEIMPVYQVVLDDVRKVIEADEKNK